MINLFFPDLSPNNNPWTSERYDDSGDENVQLQTIHDIYPSVMKQPLKNSFLDSSSSN